MVYNNNIVSQFGKGRRKKIKKLVASTDTNITTLEPVSLPAKQPSYLDKADELKEIILGKKPGCEVMIPRNKKAKQCIINIKKECKEEKKACDRYVKEYHKICDIISPIINLAYNKMDKQLSELSESELNKIIIQADTCLTMRKFHQTECIYPTCADFGHDKQIELVYQVLYDARNKLIQKKHEKLADMFLNGKITSKKYNDAISQLPNYEAISNLIVVPKWNSNVDSIKWLTEFINKNPLTSLETSTIDDQTYAIINDDRYGDEYIGRGFSLNMAYNALVYAIISRKGTQDQLNSIMKQFIDINDINVDKIKVYYNSSTKYYQATYLDWFSYIGYGINSDDAIEDLMRNIEFQLKL